MGVNDWPEADQEDFPIVEALPNETDDQAIARAKTHYSPEQECYIVELPEAL